MAPQLQKQTSETLTFQKQPAEFLTQVGTYLETLQKVYRQKLAEDELAIWAETLKSYSYQEFEQAMSELIQHPPRYEVDGQFQVWRGMPKLPDVIDTILTQREAVLAMEIRRRPDPTIQQVKQWEEQARRGELMPVDFADLLAEAEKRRAK